jgi:hypothetical protein
MQDNMDGHSSKDNVTTPPQSSEPVDNEESDNNDNDIISSPFGHITETCTKKSKVMTSPKHTKDELSEQ